jgi:phage terminase large subunit
LSKIQTNIVFEHLQNSTKRKIFEEGGMRSGKTRNIALFVVKYALENKNCICDFIRETLPSLKNSVLLDYEASLRAFGINPENIHNKTSHFFQLPTGSKIRYYSVDNDAKVHGVGRDLLHVNEAHQMPFEKMVQLFGRTRSKIICDYNPAIDDSHWLCNATLKPDSDFFQTTYKDNPFLEQAIIEEIEGFKDLENQYYWNVYGLGKRAKLEGLIYKNITYIDSIPKDAKLLGIGMDFGFSNSFTAISEMYDMGNNSLLFNELCYKREMFPHDIVNELKTQNVNKRTLISADGARPEIIKYISDAGFNITNAKKDVDFGIGLLQTRKLYCTSGSVNMKKEFSNYSYKKNGELYTNEPVKVFDHLMDANRYIASLTIADKVSKIKSSTTRAKRSV